MTALLRSISILQVLPLLLCLASSPPFLLLNSPWLSPAAVCSLGPKGGPLSSGLGHRQPPEALISPQTVGRTGSTQNANRHTSDQLWFYFGNRCTSDDATLGCHIKMTGDCEKCHLLGNFHNKCQPKRLRYRDNYTKRK